MLKSTTKLMTTLILGLSLTLCTISLAGCVSKPTADNVSNSAIKITSFKSSVDANGTDPILKSSTQVKVTTAVLQNSAQQGTREETKLSSIDSTLNSIGNFKVTDDSGIK